MALLALFTIVYNAFAYDTAHYEETIDLPPCDEYNSEVFFIKSPNDWKKINEKEYRIFCVLPGDYSEAGVITLKLSGSRETRRWLRWYDPKNKNDSTSHPVNMKIQEQATIRQLFVGDYKNKQPVQYWIVDRLVIRGSEGANWIGGGSSNNILNRLLIEEGRQTYVVFDESKKNILQNSVLRNTLRIPKTDRSLIYFSRNEDDRVVNNELYNASASGVQQGRHSLSGNIIYGNEFYVTQDYYSNCEGNLDPLGDCACCEMGVVVKGPNLPNKSLRIENNYFWGFRPTDTACAGTGSPGNAIDLGSGGYAVSNVLIEGNVIFDSSNGIYLGRNVENVLILKNLIYRIHNTQESGTAISNTYGRNVEIFKNTIIESDYWYRGSSVAKRANIQLNVILNSHNVLFQRGLEASSIVENNFLFNSALNWAKKSDQNIWLSTTYAKAEEQCIYAKKITNKSIKCIPLAKPTKDSPHYKLPAVQSNLGFTKE